MRDIPAGGRNIHGDAVEVRPGDVAECGIGGFEALVNPVGR